MEKENDLYTEKITIVQVSGRRYSGEELSSNKESITVNCIDGKIRKFPYVQVACIEIEGVWKK